MNIELRELSDDDLRLLQSAIPEEWDRRRAEAQADSAVSEAIEQVWETYPDTKPDSVTEDDAVSTRTAPQWRQPLGRHDAYPVNACVTHQGLIWKNTSGVHNVWEPGNDGSVPTWTIISIDEIPSEENDHGDNSAQEWKPGLVLNAGDRVTHLGNVYVVVQGHTTQDGWTPESLPSLFTRQ